MRKIIISFLLWLKNSVAFTSNEPTKKKSENNPSHISHKRKIQEMKYIYNEKYKILKKKTEEDTRWNNFECSYIRRYNI